MEEYEEIFKYKDRNIFIRINKETFQLGIGSKGFVIWLEKARYNTIKEAEISGVAYTKIVIDKMIHGKIDRILS